MPKTLKCVPHFYNVIAILMAVPFGAFGAILSIWAMGMSNDVYFQIGLVTLIALAAKNAILIVDFTNHLKTEGKSTYDALLESVRERLRPILMTTIAMVIGMIPIATATGSGAEWKNGLAWILIGGLTSSMFLTIIVVPMMYYIVDRIRARFSKDKKSASINLEELQPQEILI
jgi:HAE1 family hydrophobic/amphiphilic exporter-1